MIKVIKKMSELKIFKNSTSLNDKNNVMLHEDDMEAYRSWVLIEDHMVEKVLYRGKRDALSPQLLMDNNISIDTYLDGLTKIGNPDNILITYSTKDTY